MNDWSRAEHHAERAHRFFEAGEWERALSELQRALALNPDQADWQFGMGLTLESLARYDEAIACFLQVLEQRGDDVEVMTAVAVNHLRMDRPREAISMLERVNQVDPDHEPGYCHRIAAYAGLGDHDSAEAMFYLARQVVDECPLCFDHMAHSQVMRGDLDRAIWCWEQTRRLEPAFPQVLANLAEAHRLRGEGDLAYRLLVEQLRLEPGDTGTLLAMGRLQVDRGLHAEAGEKFRRALELDPTIAEARLRLARLALAAGHLESAQAELELAFRLNDQFPGIALGLGRIALARGDRTKARQYARREKRLGNLPADECLELGELFLELDEARPAIEVLTPVIDQPSGLMDQRLLAVALIDRGAAYLRAGRIHQGVRDCRRALSLDAHQLDALQNLALAYLQQGKLGRAAYWIRQGQRIAPQEPALRELRINLLAALVRRRFHRIRTSLFRRSR